MEETFNTPVQQEPVLPEKYKPLSPWAYVGYNLLFSIPLVGFILLIVYSLDSTKITRRNYARSFWCMTLVATVIAVVYIFFAARAGAGLLRALR